MIPGRNKQMICSWCHEEEASCFCGAVILDDANPEDTASGFHVIDLDYEEIEPEYGGEG